MSFGQRLKLIRKAKKISQADLAKLCNLTQQSISFIENDVNSPTVYTAQKIAEALGCSLSDLAEPPPQIYETVLTERERELISCFRRLSPQEQTFIFDSVVHAAEKYDMKFEQGDQLDGLSGA